MNKIFKDIQAEREYQIDKWGNNFDDKNTMCNWLTYIIKYVGEAYTYNQNMQWFRRCMIKVAALAVAAVEAIDRNKELPKEHWQEKNV